MVLQKLKNYINANDSGLSLSTMILMMFFAKNNIAGEPLKCTPFYRAMCCVVFFALFCTGCVLLSQEIFLQETKCILVDKSYSTFQCTGQINMCRDRKGSDQCLENCNSSNYKLALDFVVLDGSNGLNRSFGRTGCGSIDPESRPTCRCCVTYGPSGINTCETKTLYKMKYDDMCPPVLTSNLDMYEQYEIGKKYRCWTNGDAMNQGNVYPFDKSHFRESASIALIIIGGLVMICNLIYFVDRCRKNNCTCANDYEDDLE